jgi:hypothetical protein
VSSNPVISRTTVVHRAYSWLEPSVSHNPLARHGNEHGAYRTDCAGYVSMAWRLPEDGGGADVTGLIAVSEPIGKPEIKPGDVLVRTIRNHHAALFERWADEDQQAFWGLEQRTGLGAVRRRIRYPYENSSRHFRPYRYVNVVD